MKDKNKNEVQNDSKQVAELQAKVESLEEMVKTLSRANARMHNQLYDIQQILNGHEMCEAEG